MIVVLCEDSKLPHVFPHGMSVCPSYRCPAEDCQSQGKPGTCVVGRAENGEPTCLGYFAHATDDFGCDCTESPCEHMTPDHPGMEALFRRLQSWHEPVEQRIATQKAAERAKITGEPGPRHDPEPVHKKLARWSPEVMQRFPLRVDPLAVNDSSHGQPEGKK